MANAVIEKIDELFGHPEKFTPENMESLVHETLKFFNDLKEQLTSSDEKVRNEALKLAAEIKSKLEEQALALCESLGMDPQALEAYVSTPANFSTDEWQSIAKAKTELQNYKEAVQQFEKGETPVKKALKKKPKAVKEWLVG